MDIGLRMSEDTISADLQVIHELSGLTAFFGLDWFRRGNWSGYRFMITACSSHSGNL